MNDDGSTTTVGPGWNYLNFGIPVVADTFIWLTEFDGPMPARIHDTDHPNRVKGVEGLVFDLEVENLKGFSQLVRGDIMGRVLNIAGLQVWSKSAEDDFPDLHDKVFHLVAIMLRAESLDNFASVDGARETSFMSRPAIHVETNKLCWDLLIAT